MERGVITRGPTIASSISLLQREMGFIPLPPMSPASVPNSALDWLAHFLAAIAVGKIGKLRRSNLEFSLSGVSSQRKG